MSNSLEQSSDHLKGTEVFVGGLARSVTEGKIREVFSACGEIMDMRLIKDQKGSTKGFGFVRFMTKEAADKAVKELSGSTLEGKKIGVLPSTEQDTLFIGNLYKGWSADDFDKVVRQVFPDVVSVDLALPSSSGVGNLDKKKQNRGFGFVKFSSHAAAARAYRVGSKPDFLLGSLHPSVEWAEDDTEVDPKEQAKIKIAFIRSLPLTADENYLKKLFMPFGKVEKVVVSRKEQASVGFVHFSQRSDLDKAIEELNGKTLPGSKGTPSFKLQVEVARPMEKKKKRGYEELQSKQPWEVGSQSKFQKYETTYNTVGSHEATIPKVSLTADPYEASVLLLPATVKERLLRILRLGIATRFDYRCSGNGLSYVNFSTLSKMASSFLSRQGFSTSMPTPESDEGSFPSDLLTRKRVLTPERTIGRLEDLVIPVTNFHNEDKGFMVLAGDVFDVPIRKDIIHRVVRWQLAKRQQGTHSTKTISEVSGTGRKPWKQKGTGRARHGTLRGPQFRHGATMHGPKPRSHAIKLNKKVRRLGLKIALSARAAEGKLMVFDNLELPTHKTKNIVNYVNQMEETKKLLLVDGGPIDEKLKLATQNLHYVNVLPSIGLNVYSILLHDTLVMSRDAVNRIVDRMHTPINR